MSASDIAGKRIREARTARGWRVKDLADECAKAGADHLTADIITNLETRRRVTREITADELLVLAYVLDVPPVQLISPLNAGEELQVTPSVQMDVLEAAAWLGNENTALQGVLDRQKDGPPQVRPRSAVNPANMLRSLWRTSQLIRGESRTLRREPGNTDARKGITQKGHQVMVTLGRLADLGYEPPELDPEVTAGLNESGLPASLPEWRARQESESHF